jgi:hypothetical protein
VALFRNRGTKVSDLIGRATRVFLEFSPEDDYFREVLVPFLAELCGALMVNDFTSADDLEAIAQPLESMPPVKAVMCAGSVLHSAGKQFRKAPLGDILAQLVASKGLMQAWKAVPLVRDNVTARRVASAMDILWTYEPTPFRELDHAQVVYVSGHLALVAGEGRDALKKHWQDALRLLDAVDPGAAATADGRSLIASTKQNLRRSWIEQLAELGF